MSRKLAFAYGILSYLVFFVTFLYAVGFLGNFGVPKSIDSPRDGSLVAALAINALLLVVFAVQHSVMARPAFKRWWTRLIPEAVERSTYVLASSLALILLFWLWRPLGGSVWEIENTVGRTAAYASYAFGWILLFVSTFMLNHFDLFGLRQVWLHLQGKPYTPLEFKVPSAYKVVRHPIYVAWLFIIWSTPSMTVTHLFFAVGSTAYILVGIQLEERDLLDYHPEYYAEYRRNVPMLIPRLKRRSSEESVDGKLAEA